MANEVQRFLVCRGQDVVDHGGQVLHSHFVPAKAPEGILGSLQPDVALRVADSPAVAQPHVVAAIGQHEWKSAPRSRHQEGIGQADQSVLDKNRRLETVLLAVG